MISIFNGDGWISISSSLFFIPDETTYEQWSNHFFEGVSALKDRPYTSESLVKFDIKVYAVQSPGKFSIGPLRKASRLNPKSAVLDIETVVLKDNSLLPYAIGFYFKSPEGAAHLNVYYSTDFLPEGGGPFTESEHITASNLIMVKALTTLHSACPKYTVYVHNLGGFDSTFLLKPLATLFGEYKLLLDGSNKVISITLNNKLMFKDSYRIFPTSLKELSNIFKVPIPKGEFNHSEVTLDSLAKIQQEAIEYLKKDLHSLYDAMLTAGRLIFNEYNVDLSNVFSTSSLAMKIYRTNFLNSKIPLLPT